MFSGHNSYISGSKQNIFLMKQSSLVSNFSYHKQAFKSSRIATLHIEQPIIFFVVVPGLPTSSQALGQHEFPTWARQQLLGRWTISVAVGRLYCAAPRARRELSHLRPPSLRRLLSAYLRINNTSRLYKLRHFYIKRKSLEGQRLRYQVTEFSCTTLYKSYSKIISLAEMRLELCED